MEEDYSNTPAHRFAREIADAMGRQWQYDGEVVNNNRVGYIDGPNAGRLGIVLDPWYDDPEHGHNNYRVKVIGCYPKFMRDTIRPHEHESPEITCAPTRTPESIARDIQNRFLPDYWPALDEAHETAGRYEREFYAMLDGMGVLSETLEAKFEPDPSIGRTPVIRYSGKDIRATVEWNGNYGVSMELRWLPLEVAVEVAELLKRHEDRQIPAHLKGAQT